MANRRQQRLRGRFSRAISGAGDQETVERARDFDFRSAFDESMRGYRRDFMEDFGREAEGVRSSLAGSGRLLTGFGEEDYRRWEDEQGENFANASARMARALATKQYNARQQSADRYLELLSGGLDREQARENAKRQQLASILQGVGSAASIIPFL